MNKTLTAYHQTKEQIDQEQILVAEAKKDPSKFAGLYKKYYQQIFLFILKRVEDEETAAEITSQVFLKVLTNLAGYRDMGLPFSSWLFRIARNEIYDLHRQKKIQMVVSVESRGIGEMISEMQDEEEPVSDHEMLYKALGTLEDDEMELMEMRFFEKRSFKEIGEILEITDNNAKVRSYRVLDKLKKILKK